MSKCDLSNFECSNDVAEISDFLEQSVDDNCEGLMVGIKPIQLEMLQVFITE